MSSNTSPTVIYALVNITGPIFSSGDASVLTKALAPQSAAPQSAAPQSAAQQPTLAALVEILQKLGVSKADPPAAKPVNLDWRRTVAVALDDDPRQRATNDGAPTIAQAVSEAQKLLDASTAVPTHIPNMLPPPPLAPPAPESKYGETAASALPPPGGSSAAPTSQNSQPSAAPAPQGLADKEWQEMHKIAGLSLAQASASKHS